MASPVLPSSQEKQEIVDYQYEFDGHRLARGLLRLNFRSIVPRTIFLNEWSEEVGLYISNEHGVFARNSCPNVQSWSIECNILVNTHNPFCHDQLPVQVKITEPFTAAGRTKVSVLVTSDLLSSAHPSSPNEGFDFVFTVKKSPADRDDESKSVSPVIPPHTIRVIPRGNGETFDDDIEDYLSCKRVLVPLVDWCIPPRLIIGEAASNLGIGGKVWDGSIAMLDFLFAEKDRWAGLLGLPEDTTGFKIVDLGSGTGVLGFGLAAMKAKSIVVHGGKVVGEGNSNDIRETKTVLFPDIGDMWSHINQKSLYFFKKNSIC